ncbi:MAG: dTDP-glucose 4,6-dehydratase [Proteobacteria bacterium]|nr:dTDP-glucose 4,6-dehydratase [Pseudomonadota bacterium]
MKILITGGAGFIGSNFIRYILKTHPDHRVVNLDALTYAGNLENLRAVAEAEGGGPRARYQFVKGDIREVKLVDRIVADGVEAIINFAAESHVDRSIDNAGIFIETNVLGTQVLLDAALRHQVQRYVQISTDEVYGSLGPTGKFTESTPIAPNSPYSASKAGADLLVRSYYETFKLPALITRCSNNYGPYQFPEKLIPLFITNALSDQHLPLYGDGLNVRDWIHVEDHCAAIDCVLHRGTPGEVYNIGGNCEKTNREITRIILQELDKPESLIRFVKDRPGHDRRYAIDSTKIMRELGWAQNYNFQTGMQETVTWYSHNREWWTRVKSGEYRDFYQRWYGNR